MSEPIDMLDKEAPQEELQELAGDRKVRVRIDPQEACAAGVRETDRGIDIYFNPKQIRSEVRLQEHINWIKGRLV